MDQNSQNTQNPNQQTADTQNPPPTTDNLQATSTPPPTIPPSEFGKKSVTGKFVATILGVLFLIGGVAAGVLLVSQQQEIREQAKTGTCIDYAIYYTNGSSDTGTFCDGNTVTRSDDPNLVANSLHISCSDTFSSDGTAEKSDLDGHLITSFYIVKYDKDGNIKQTCGEEQISTTPTPTPTVLPSCPANTTLLFSKAGRLSVGDTLEASGELTLEEGSWSVGSRNGILMAEGGRTMRVDFPKPTLLDTVLIFDNDPKSGEQPWSINGTSLTVTDGGKWAPPFKLNLTTTQMNFDNGGDSPHFNICIKEVTTPTSTPTPTLKLTPTPHSTPTPTITPTPPPIGAACLDVKAYDTNWNPLDSVDLSNLKAGDTIRYAVAGTTTQGAFDKARFTINGTLRPEVSSQKPGSDEFFDEYTIPPGVESFTVSAQIHHTTLGWF